MANRLRWIAMGLAGGLALGLALPVKAQDSTTLLTYFLNDLRAGTLGSLQTITSITATNLTLGSTGTQTWSGRTTQVAPGIGVQTFGNTSNSIGFRIQFGNIPTFSSGFGTSPSIVAGSSDSAFSVNVGTGGAATSGVVNFATTWIVAPMCIAQDSTTVGAGAQKVATTTSAATITTAVAWTASDIVNVFCFGAKS